MSNISIFAKPPFLNINPSQPFIFGTPIKRGHLMRVSSLIRGNQMAEKLNCKLNPTEGFEDDVCIYVKPHVKANEDFKFEGKPFMDIVDGWGLVPLLQKHPEVPVIAMSQWDAENLARVLKNKIIFIPQHHVNYERLKRHGNSTINVGIVGTEASFPFVPGELKRKLAERGMKLVELSKFDTRQGIQEFYQDLYVQIVWRPYRRRMGNPLKLVNGASFGVPTIALYEETFKEMDGYYIPVKTLDEFIEQLDNLRSNPRLYDEISSKCIEKAEEYHIDNIANLYRKLCTI
jgi:glycosyltransferase involved in cell wall biosynthesis